MKIDPKTGKKNPFHKRAYKYLVCVWIEISNENQHLHKVPRKIVEKNVEKC